MPARRAADAWRRSPLGSTPGSTSCCDAERSRWAAVDPELAGPFDEIRRMVRSGGKRLRPAFCHWGFVGAGGDPADERGRAPARRSS